MNLEPYVPPNASPYKLVAAPQWFYRLCCSRCAFFHPAGFPCLRPRIPPPPPARDRVIEVIDLAGDTDEEINEDEDTIPLPGAELPEARNEEVVVNRGADSPYYNRLNPGFYLRLGRDQPLLRGPTPLLPRQHRMPSPIAEIESGRRRWFRRERDVDEFSSSSSEVDFNSGRAFQPLQQDFAPCPVPSGNSYYDFPVPPVEYEPWSFDPADVSFLRQQDDTMSSGERSATSPENFSADEAPEMES